jgi:hypothetical protein
MMFLRRLSPIRSSFGLLVAAGAITLAVSPTARKKAREWMFRGMSAVLGFTDQLSKKEVPLKPKMEMDEHDFDFRKWEGMVNATTPADVEEKGSTSMTNATLHTGANLHTEKTAGMNAAQIKLNKQPFTPTSTPDLKAQGPQTARENNGKKRERSNTLGNESSSSHQHP